MDPLMIYEKGIEPDIKQHYDEIFKIVRQLLDAGCSMDEIAGEVSKIVGVAMYYKIAKKWAVENKSSDPEQA